MSRNGSACDGLFTCSADLNNAVGNSLDPILVPIIAVFVIMAGIGLAGYSISNVKRYRRVWRVLQKIVWSVKMAAFGCTTLLIASVVAMPFVLFLRAEPSTQMEVLRWLFIGGGAYLICVLVGMESERLTQRIKKLHSSKDEQEASDEP